MFKRQSRFMKASALSALAAFSVATFQAQPASAYNYATHSRIAELAVRAMNGFCFGAASPCTPPVLKAPKGEETQWAAYLAAVKAAPAKLVLLKTGLPTSTIAGGFSPIPGDSDDTTAYPFSASSPATCSLLPTDTTVGKARDLNRLNDFRIADLDYFPQRDGSKCGLQIPSENLGDAQGSVASDPTKQNAAQITERVNELVLGWHAAGVDDHLNDSALWIRPTLVGTWGVYFEAASWVWEAAVGTILLPFALLWSLFSGHHVSLDASYALARQYNPVDEIQGAIPGIGDIRDDTFTGLWHFEAVDAGVNRFNDTRGMWYPGAGPTSPGAFDVAILAATQVSGLSLNANIADGPGNYGGFDKIHRTWPQWQAHSVGMLEWSPLHNLAAYGWSRFKSDPSDAIGLGWPLHAIGDACEPQHVTSTSSWGHRTYEDWVSGDSETVYLPRVFDPKTGVEVTGAQAKLDAELADALVAGFRWWKEFNNGQNMATLIHDLAVETRAEIRNEGDWPFKDSYSTRYVVGGDTAKKATADYGAEVMAGHDADVKRLLTNAIGASIAVLAVAAPQIKNNLKGTLSCPAGQVYVLQQVTRHVQPSRGPAYDQVYTVPGCGAAVAAVPPGPTPESLGIGVIGAASGCSTGPCKPGGADCTTGAECAVGVCTGGSCGYPIGNACKASSDCSSGICSSKGVCVSPNGWGCTTAAECASGSCSVGTCGSPGGATCAKGSDCASAACSGGKCLTPSGGTCTADSQCLSGVPCYSGICGKPNGELCMTAIECVSDECAAGHCGKGYQEPCETSAECSNDNCIDGQCGPGS